jgi:hypothetical protein
VSCVECFASAAVLKLPSGIDGTRHKHGKTQTDLLIENLYCTDWWENDMLTDGGRKY